MDYQNLAAALDSRVGYQVPPMVAKAILASECARQPQMLELVRAHARNGGAVEARNRADVLYSTIFVGYAAGTGAPPQNIGDWFAQGIGAQNNVIGGPVGELYTNLTEGGKQDASQAFIVERLGFNVFVYAPQAAATADDYSQAIQDLFAAVGVSYQSGKQTTQLFGPIEQFPAPRAFNISAGQGAGATPNVTTVGGQLTGPNDMWKVKPTIKIGAGQSFRWPSIYDNTRPRTIANLADVVFGIRLTLLGKSLTAIDG